MRCLALLAIGLCSAAPAASDWRAELHRAVSAELPVGARIALERVFVAGNVPKTANVRVMSPHPPVGMISFELSWTRGGELAKAYGKATCRAWAKVAIAREPMGHGVNIDESKVSFEERELLPHSLTGFFTDLRAVSRLKAKGYLRPGQVLDGANTQAPADIERGQSLDLVVSRGSATLTAKVTALQSGNRGEWIRVENPATSRVLNARVTAPGRAEVQ